jgi:site-specific DNA-methyltransferase (adenine-specific)/site-specific DNA-methyltransferase (cytosine-N4-specific)
MILEGDCFELIKEQADNSVDLIITSPPYADIVNYGKNISIKKPDEYVDWIIPLFKDIYRVLKPSGSFILNINDNCSNGVRNTFIYDLISRNNKETKLKLYDTYIWHKRNGIPNGGTKRFRNTTEFIFHFVKNQKELKFYMDRVLEDTKEETKYRFSRGNITQPQGRIDDGARTYTKVKVRKIRYTNIRVDENGSQDNKMVYRNMPDKVRPDNVFRFSTAGAARDNHIKHPAPFHKELPTYFINLLTDEGDIVLDVFAGIGTTGLACKELDRTFIGYELNPKYCEFGNKRISGEELETYRVVQYDLDGNYIADYKNRMEASKATGVQDGDIMRTYNRTKFDSRGGFIWKLEPEYVIKQYDMNDNFIQSFNSPTEACKAINYPTFHNILMCYRGHRNEAGGYKWKLEKNNYGKE